MTSKFRPFLYSQSKNNFKEKVFDKKCTYIKLNVCPIFSVLEENVKIT